MRTSQDFSSELPTFLKAASILAPSVQQFTSGIHRVRPHIGAPSLRMPSVGSSFTSGRWAEIRSAVSTALDMLERMMCV